MCKFKTINLFILLFFLVFGANQIFAQPIEASTQQPFYTNDLPVIKDLGLRVEFPQGGNIDVSMEEITQDLGLKNITGGYSGSTVWGYKFPGLPATYPGATIVAKKNKTLQVKWINNLPGQFLPVDASLHMAHGEIPSNITDVTDQILWIRGWYAAGNVPTVTHLHGGRTESPSDGLPEAWFTQGFNETGAHFVKQRYWYDNDQESATLWYHDHALGITRLNVYAGLAGFYFLRDDNEEKLISQNVLPGGDYEVEIVIQDRMFDEDGELFWPANPGDPAYSDFIFDEEAELDRFSDDEFPGGGPTALAEFFGNIILVNGKVWPKLEVEPRKYRFRLLNGSDSRFYLLELRDSDNETYTAEHTAHSFLQIGTDDGLLPRPVALNQLLIAPGERMDIVVDFSEFEGESLYLRNFAPDDPYGGGEPETEFDISDPNSTGQIMRFDVTKPFDGNIPNAKVKEMSRLRMNIMPLVQEGATRNLVLFEGRDEYDRLMPMLGTLQDGSLTWSDPITENPMMNDTEVWEVYNATGDAHPIHLHLVSFQIINREPFSGSEAVSDKTDTGHNGRTITGGYLDANDVTLSGDVREPADNEKGWKDTAVMLPGEVTRVIAHFNREGRYVWHCHILSHEDHEMMRPFYVSPKSNPKTTSDVLASVGEFRLNQNFPNPFNPSTTINFSIPKENALTSLKIYNSLGEEVGTLINQVVPAGNHEVQFDASELSSGVYFYVLRSGNFVDSRKMILMK